jgi:hypothetical protein
MPTIDTNLGTKLIVRLKLIPIGIHICISLKLHEYHNKVNRLTLSSNFCMLGIKNTDSAKIPIQISEIKNPKNTRNPNMESKLGTSGVL